MAMNNHRDSMTYGREEIASAYREWAMDLVNGGFEPYFLTAMFQQLEGSPSAVRAQMRREMERIYGIQLTRHIKHPRKAHLRCLPFWLIAEDLPVPKHDRDHFRDIVANDGLHIHILALIPPNTRMKESLSDHIEEEQHLYSGPNRKLSRLHALPIVEKADYVVGYGLKAFEKSRTDDDGIMVLPRAWSEMTTPRARIGARDSHLSAVDGWLTMVGREPRQW